MAVLFVAEHELPFEVGAPEAVGGVGRDELGALSLVAAAFAPLHEPVPIEHGVDRAGGRRLDHRQLAYQLVADLRGAPGRVFPLDPEDGAFDLERQLVGVPIRSAAAVIEGVKTAFLVAVEDLVAGDPRNAELTAHRSHLLALEQPSYKSEAFIHRFTLLPEHRGSPQKADCVNHVSGIRC
jgi:hypothetical protein